MVINLNRYRALKMAALSLLKTGAHENGIVRPQSDRAVIYTFVRKKPATVSPELPEDLSNVDVAAFLGRVYTLATQI